MNVSESVCARASVRPMFPGRQKHIVRAAESKGGRDTINFADPNAVRLLNAALLKVDYGIQDWHLPPEKLCPPVPGRADYVHHLADILHESTRARRIPEGTGVVGLDIGTGSSLIYPLLGASSYGWKFLGSECDPDSFASAERIASANPGLDISVRYQPSPSSLLAGVIDASETIDFIMCNPPFFDSPEARTMYMARICTTYMDPSVVFMDRKTNRQTMMHAHTHARTHARTRKRACTHTHTHTQTNTHRRL